MNCAEKPTPGTAQKYGHPGELIIPYRTKVDIYFNAVGMMNVPDKKEILAITEEMKNDPKSLKLVS